MTADISMQPHHCFDNAKVTRMIALGYPKSVVLEHFEPLVKHVIRGGLSYDPRNHDETDLVQIGLMVCNTEVIDKFDVTKGNLFHYATILVRHALWSAVQLKPMDKARTQDEVDFDMHPSDLGQEDGPDSLPMPADLLAKIRVDSETSEDSARYVYGVFLDDIFEANRARVLTTLVKGFDINPKHARFVADHVLVQLRLYFSKIVPEVRDDKLFDNKFKHSLVPELREFLGERAFERLIHFFGGLSISIPDHPYIDSIDRDLTILKALSLDWTCGPMLAKKFRISPEGVKTAFKATLHRLHTDEDFRELVSAHIDLDKIPGFDNPASPKRAKKALPSFGEKKPPRRKILNTDSMGFALGSRNSLLYTLIATGKCTREQLVATLHQKFGGNLSSAKSTVSAFLSDIRQPYGKFNTSRGLAVLLDPKGRLQFDKDTTAKAQAIVRAKRAKMMAEVEMAS